MSVKRTRMTLAKKIVNKRPKLPKPNIKKAKEYIHNHVKDAKLRKRTILSLATMAIAIGIISLTLGKTIFSGQDPALSSFLILNFSGYLFFLLMPVEIMVPYYLSQGHSGLILIIGAVITAMIAQVFDYALGYLASKNIIFDLIGEKRYKKTKKTINKYGDWIIFLFNLFPLSSPIAVLIGGMLRLKFKRVMFLSFAGLTLKYIAIVLIFSWL